MKNKSKLKGTKYYIESDFTKSEERIQKKVREIAKEEKVKGKIAVVKYQKIKINGKWMFWDTSRSVLAESKSINFSKKLAVNKKETDTLTTTAMKRHMIKRKTERRIKL
ncbi:hypothetical protein QE152_g10466 [Popillia japonica]|uniref:Uncharacterized protein n=1 Tax=Popillia japonica TaxID=7064 RepID=A0AAW1LUK1_POPJA